RGRLGQPEIAHLAGLHQFGHRPNRVLDRRPGIDPVLVVEVDHVHAQAPEAGVAALPDVRWVAADAEDSARAPDVAELGCYHDPVAAPPDGLADQGLVLPDPIHIGRVEEVTAGIEVAMNDAQRLLVIQVLGVVVAAHAHAAQADCRHLEAAPAQFTLGHGVPLSVLR